MRLLKSINGDDVRHSRGFTLVELMVCVTIIAVTAVFVTPMFRDGERLHVVAATRILTSDIELAQIMTISFPDQPVVVKFNPDEARYWLAYESDPDTPIIRTGSEEPYTVQFGAGRAAAASDVTLELTNVTDNTLAFNAQGGLLDFTSSPEITLSRSGASVRLGIAPTTGRISELTR